MTRVTKGVLTGAVSVAAALTLATQAAAEVRPFDRLDCTPDGEIRVCEGDESRRIPSFDGLPIEANVYLPATGDRRLRLVILIGGYPQGKIPPDVATTFPSPRSLAERGFAVLTFDGRGMFGSCGISWSSLDEPAECVDGYTHLADSRFEVRDAQHLAGLLADQRLIDPRGIGVVGESYGGGQALQLAALRNRIRLPDGRYERWKSPVEGLPMRIAAAVPSTAWSDFAYGLAPNGRTIDYLDLPRAANIDPIGIVKTSFFGGTLALGADIVYQPPPGADPESDPFGWFTALHLGEPYGPNAKAHEFVTELSANHSALGLVLDRMPAPTLLASGFTDDFFPAAETLRIVNHVQSRFPKAELAQLYGDFGHPRAQSKHDALAALHRRTLAWLDRYVNGDERIRPGGRVVAFTQTCPREAASGGPFRASSWRRLHPGEVRFRSDHSATVSWPGGDPQVAAALDPVAGQGACAQLSADSEPGTASYELPPTPRPGHTLLGSPTVIADLETVGTAPENAQLAARLWDVSPDRSSQTLVSRALYRPGADGRQVFQLHANGYRFEPGHIPKLQLLGGDAPYGRPPNQSFTVSVSDVDLRLPVAERRGRGVTSPAPLFVPAGASLAPGYLP